MGWELEDVEKPSSLSCRLWVVGISMVASMTLRSQAAIKLLIKGLTVEGYPAGMVSAARPFATSPTRLYYIKLNNRLYLQLWY